MIKITSILRICAMTAFGVCHWGCDGAPYHKAGGALPTVPPIWIVEDDPKMTIYERKDLQDDRRVGEMLVIPLYANYQHQGTADSLAIAHPFVYQQGKDIEKHLSSFGQRDKLCRLVFWVPSYFPDGLGKMFSWVPVINGRRMVVVELQRCLGSEQNQIDAAMKTLLEGDFVIGEAIPAMPPSPPHTDNPKMTTSPYDLSQLVRAVQYCGRFYVREYPRHLHLLRAFDPGTTIVNRLTPEEKRTVAKFAIQAKQAAGKEGEKSSENKR